MLTISRQHTFGSAEIIESCRANEECFRKVFDGRA